MNNPRVYHLRDGKNNVLGRAELTFDLQQNMHHLIVENPKTKKDIHFEYEDPNELTRYIKLGVIELNIYGFDHFIEELMPV